ncbi:formate dehydrogenase accessory sulfurtransferase FdhD [Tropicimonas sp.]|uniref:formate dehydrogenase accessory sulfurtransferase FdhD n=1 Tax=Tropicimonas sp. TaxID=2067044 RepID=UPI003A8A8678
MGRQAVIDGGLTIGRDLAEEVPVALVYNGATQAVMMATPADLEDFACGFSVAEGIVDDISQIGEVEIARHGRGIELRIWLPAAQEARLAARRRAAAGPVGCGLCGIESIEQALRPPAQVPTAALRLNRADLADAAGALQRGQALHDATGAVHAAGLWRPGSGLVRLREDVGRHNALDKLIGGTLRAGESGAGAAVVLTSRVSVDMVQKSAALGAEAIIAISAPTALAVEMARTAGLTLVSNLKGGRPRVLAHPFRLVT